MSKYKYEPLKKYFLGSNNATIILRYDEINKILGSDLPPCLSGIRYDKPLLWNNKIRFYATRSWLEAGYICERYDRKNKDVTFRKNEIEARKFLSTK